eukprot:TRINITY_DN4176_c0_g1_i1.p1 TRINITY_DN4176_c0_g1~~TRINITY_DN4176_c0_g1_i1.p1  ORF type:complete len:118 (-),score=13.33 TRINITY_DN4176_c0_g1_i1:76-429(-)
MFSIINFLCLGLFPTWLCDVALFVFFLGFRWVQWQSLVETTGSVSGPFCYFSNDLDSKQLHGRKLYVWFRHLDIFISTGDVCPRWLELYKRKHFVEKYVLAALGRIKSTCFLAHETK